jgi:hypothetical protein
LLSAPLRTQADLYAFHRRFAAAGDRVRRAVIVAQLAVAVCAAWAAAPTLVAAGITVVAGGFATWASSRTLTERAETRVTARQLASDM